MSKVDDAIDDLEEVTDEYDLSEKDWDSVDDASDYLFEHKVKKTWKEVLKDDWVKRKPKPRIKETDKIIEYLKINADSPLMSIIKDLKIHMRMKKVRVFLEGHPNITSRKKPVGASGQQTILYRYEER